MAKSILDIIGNTPLVEIRRMNPNPAVQILAKLEFTNPGGSVKDRAALSMIEAAESSGELTRDKTILEATSGNTGIGLALVCSVKGYRLLLVMSESVSVERRQILKARGAELLLTPGHLGTDGAIEEVYRLAREKPNRYFVVDQFSNEANWKAHYHGTAEEIWQQTGGQVTMVVTALGTTGTAMGLSGGLKRHNPSVRIVGVEPYLGHKIQGLKNMKEAYCPEIFDKQQLDKKINIEDEDAYDTARRLAREEGIFAGMSSGAAMAAALHEAQEMSTGLIVVILPDSGERYLSTPLYAVQAKINMQLLNVLGRSKQSFNPVNSDRIGIYTCGPTAAGPLQLGELRRFVFADLLNRYFEQRGFGANHVVDINDLDDNTVAAAESAHTDLGVHVKNNLARIRQDLSQLGVKPADHTPLASEHVEAMVALAEELTRKGYAYERLRSLYFDISRLDEYGRLSGIDVEKIKVGATVDLEAYEKQNPRDFTIFRRCRLSDLKRGLFTKTQWGNVRPSWHIKSAAMSMAYLGAPFDIHISSRELMFPHHENENAIACAVNGRPLANYWLMCDGVAVEDMKTGRDSDTVTLSSLLQSGFSRRELRFWLLSTHYRKSLLYSEERLIDCRRALSRLDRCIRSLQQVNHGKNASDVDQLAYDLRYGFYECMDDDFNISRALAAVYRVVRKVNGLLAEGAIGRSGATSLLEAFIAVDAVIQVMGFDRHDADPKIRNLIAARQQARQDRNWKLADRLRDELLALGVTVRDDKISD
jgi:cysteinyl-tRNA synthetase